MKYLTVANWDKWQSYRKDRGTPPWIKVHRKIMSNPDWAMLTDAEKGQIISIWIVAADNNGRVPNDANVLRKVCQLDDTPDVKRLVQFGFLSTEGQPIDNQVTTTCQPSDAPEKRRGEKRREEKKRGTFSNVFLTNDEYEKLIIKFNSSTDGRINTLSEYMKSKGKRYKSHYATILTWARNDKPSETENQFAGVK